MSPQLKSNPIDAFKHRFTWSIGVLLIMIGWVCPVRTAADALLDAIDNPPDVSLCGEVVPLHHVGIRERYEKEMLLTLGDRPQALLWLKRAQRYFPFIEEALRRRQMPEDLKFLAVAESALRPHAGSSKGAVGFWQLMPETARRYGLTVNARIDERRDLVRSTPAALAYLAALHEQFKSWTLAIAAYNMGEQGLTAEILEQGSRDYYQLYLPLETQRFVFRVLSVKLVLGDPQRYGFDIVDAQRYKPLVFDTVEIDFLQETPIRLVARSADTTFKRVKDLNPHIRGYHIQAGRHRINLPKGSSKGIQVRMDRIVDAYRHAVQKRIYIVNRGDSLSSIAERFDVPVAALLIWNRIDLQHTLHPGDRLIIDSRRLEQIPESP